MRIAELEVFVEDAPVEVLVLDVDDGLTEVDTGVAAASVAFLQVRSLGVVALAESVRSAH